jgi:hypothetical protein
MKPGKFEIGTVLKPQFVLWQALGASPSSGGTIDMYVDKITHMHGLAYTMSSPTFLETSSFIPPASIMWDVMNDAHAKAQQSIDALLSQYALSTERTPIIGDTLIITIPEYNDNNPISRGRALLRITNTITDFTRGMNALLEQNAPYVFNMRAYPEPRLLRETTSDS